MYDTRYSNKVDTGKLKVKAKATQFEIPISQLDNKPKTSKRKLSPEGSSAKDGSSTKPLII